MQTLIERVTSTPEGLALFQQEGLILEVTDLIYRLMQEHVVNKAELAARLGKSRSYVTQMLAGRANLTLRTVSDVLTALGESPRVTSVPLTIGGRKRPGRAATTILFPGAVDPTLEIEFEHTSGGHRSSDHHPGILELTA